MAMAAQVSWFDLQLTFPSHHSLPILFCKQIFFLRKSRGRVFKWRLKGPENPHRESGWLKQGTHPNGSLSEWVSFRGKNIHRLSEEISQAQWGSSLDSQPRPEQPVTSQGTRRRPKGKALGPAAFVGGKCWLQFLYLPMKITAHISTNERPLVACFPINFPTKKLNVKWICQSSVQTWQPWADTRERTNLSRPLFSTPPLLVGWCNSYLELDRM